MSSTVIMMITCGDIRRPFLRSLQSMYELVSGPSVVFLTLPFIVRLCESA